MFTAYRDIAPLLNDIALILSCIFLTLYFSVHPGMDLIIFRVFRHIPYDFPQADSTQVFHNVSFFIA